MAVPAHLRCSRALQLGEACSGFGRSNLSAALCSADNDAMLNPETLDRIVHRLSDSLPAGVEKLGRDVQEGIRASLRAALEKMDLVSREEYDIQTAVLEKTRAKLNELEERIRRLEEETP